MRKLILSMQISLDGFIEGPNGDMSWMAKDDNEGWDDLFDMLKTVDLLVLGRVMFPEYRDYWKQALTNPKATANEVRYARLAETMKHIVFSNTMKDPHWNNTTIINGDAAEALAKIKQQPGKDIQIVGGAKLAASLMDAGLVDEYRLIINPAIIGEGKSFFRDQHKRQMLKLIGLKKLKQEMIIARYAPK